MAKTSIHIEDSFTSYCCGHRLEPEEQAIWNQHILDALDLLSEAALDELCSQYMQAGKDRWEGKNSNVQLIVDTDQRLKVLAESNPPEDFLAACQKLWEIFW